MFTKTGLRPRETHSRSGTGSDNAKGNGGFARLNRRSEIGEKPRSISATRRRQVPTAHLGPTATTRKSTIERGRATSAVSTRGGAQRVAVAWEALPSSTRRKGFYGIGGRSRSAGRMREVSTTPRARHPIHRRPEWDDSLRDTSQYRLTPEEAMRRKISMVSKHNTLVFGLGSGSTPTETGTCSSSVTAAEEAARRRSAKRVEHHQQRSRQARTCVVSSANGKRVSAIYSGGGDGRGRMRSEVALEPASATEHDLTGAASRQGSDAIDACGVNDATINLYAKRGGSADSNTCERRYDDGSSGGSSSGSGQDGGEDEVEVNLPVGKGDSGVGLEVSSSSDLAGIEVGIESFSKRVGRLEAYRKAGLEGERTLGERGGLSSEAENRVRDQAGGGGGSQSEDVSLCLTEIHEGVASGELLYQRQRCHANANHDDSGNHLPADTRHDHDGSDGNPHHHQSHQHHSHHSSANPWSFSASSPESSSREQRLLRKAVTSCSPSTSDDGGRDEVGLVKRIQVLEAQVGKLGSVRPSATPVTTAAASFDNGGGNQKTFSHLGVVGSAAETGREEPAVVGGVDAGGQPGSATREEQMRAVIENLLSLSAVLLERATEAERRLRDVADYGHDSNRVVGDETGGDAGDIDKRARLVRASAEAVVAPAGDGDNTVVPPTATNHGMVTIAAPSTAAATTAPTATVSAVASALPEEVAALPSGRSLKTGSPPARAPASAPFPPPPPPPPRLSTTPRSSTNDCWGEALDAVGRLVDNHGSEFNRDEEEAVAVLSTGTETPTSSSTPPSPRRFSSSLGLRPLPTEVAAAVSSGTSYQASTSKQTGSVAVAAAATVAEQLPLQPPPPVWRPARQDGDDAAPAAPVKRTLLADDGCVTAGPVHFSLSSPCAVVPNGVEGVEDEDARASPASSAPIPSNMPQHPFRGNRTGPRMRTARWLRQPVVHAEGGESVSGPGQHWSRFSAASTARDEGRDDESMRGGSSGWDQGRGICGGDNIDVALRPPIGQWYTPPANPGVRE